MPCTARASVGGLCYHALNQGNGCRILFHKAGDFAAFLKVLAEVCRDSGDTLFIPVPPRESRKSFPAE